MTEEQHQAAASGEVPQEEPAEETEKGGMTLLEHLGELRKRLVRCAIAVFVGFLACYAFAEQLFDILLLPMTGILTDGHFQYTSPPEAFFTYMKVAFVAGIFVSSPYIFYQLWAFISPGLYEHERKWIVPISVGTALLFMSGALFGYFVVFPFGFEFFASYSNDKIQFIPKLNEYTTFCLQLLLAFGLIFELPLFMLILAKLGIVDHVKLKKFRKYAILIIFIVAAILTPPDPFTQTLMAVPLMILYEVSIWVAKVFGRKPRPKVAEDEEGEAPRAVAAPAPAPAVEGAAPAAALEEASAPDKAAADEPAATPAPAAGVSEAGESGPAEVPAAEDSAGPVAPESPAPGTPEPGTAGPDTAAEPAVGEGAGPAAGGDSAPETAAPEAPAPETSGSEAAENGPADKGREGQGSER